MKPEGAYSGEASNEPRIAPFPSPVRVIRSSQAEPLVAPWQAATSRLLSRPRIASGAGVAVRSQQREGGAVDRQVAALPGREADRQAVAGSVEGTR